jgi:hypothetical protein
MKKIMHTKSNGQWWRKSLIWGFILAIGIINFGCEKKCDIDDSEEYAEYYVKYEVSSTTIYYGGKLDVILNSEKNQETAYIINQRQTWEAIIGPVQKGFVATLKVNATGNTYNQLRLYTNIYVSKNGSPFALKNSDGSDIRRDEVQLNYTIDY